jgi:hypothetical protein
MLRSDWRQLGTVGSQRVVTYLIGAISSLTTVGLRRIKPNAWLRAHFSYSHAYVRKEQSALASVAQITSFTTHKLAASNELGCS